MKNLRYAVSLTPDVEDGGFVVTCRDLPPLITQGDDVLHALAEARDAMGEVLAGYIEDNVEFPAATAAERGEFVVSAPVLITLKAALRDEMLASRVSNVDLAARMDSDEKLVRRLLDPKHASRVSSLERALTVLGASVVVTFRPGLGVQMR